MRITIPWWAKILAVGAAVVLGRRAAHAVIFRTAWIEMSSGARTRLWRPKR